jgi:hypothetical protein
MRRQSSKKIVEDLEQWLRGDRKKLSAKGPLVQVIDYGFNRWQVFTRFLGDGRICVADVRP